MKLNTEYERIYILDAENRNALNGKIVDKFGFIHKGYADENIFAITFTDKTFIAIGIGNSEWDDFYKGEPALENFAPIDPENYGSLYDHVYLNENGKPEIYRKSFVKVLVDLGIWDVTAEECLKRMEKERKF